MQQEQLPDGGTIPALGLGTWQIGGGGSPDYSRDDEMVAILQKAIEMGYTHFDTAEGYGKGHSEELIGRAIRGYDRDALFITSKVSPEHLHADQVHRSLDGTLERLGTDYLDLYLIHWPNRSIPLTETMPALNKAVTDGRIKRIGVSNFDVDLMQQAVDLAETPIATNQVKYSLLHREPEQNGVLAYCQEHGIILTAYSPVKGGVLGHPTVRAVAERHGCTPAQVAIQWLIRQPQVITIPKSADEAHLRDNLEALSIQLTEDDVDQLNQASQS